MALVDSNVSDLYSVAGGGELVRRPRMPAPRLSIDAHLCTPWLEVNVRSFTLDEPLDVVFRPSMCYLDLCLTQRSAEDRGAFVDAAGEPPCAPLGDSVLVPAGQTFHVRCAPMDRRVVCCMFEAARFDALRDWEWGGEELASCRDLRLPPVRDAMRQLAREALQPGFGGELMAESLLLSSLVQISRHFRRARPRPEEAGGRLAPWQLRRVRDRVEEAIGPSPGLVELAAECRISPRHLSRTFKNTTGATLGAFIADARVRQAKALLARSDVQIKAVAYDCGFASAAAFAAAFRRATGHSPREYRQGALGMSSAAMSV